MPLCRLALIAAAALLELSGCGGSAEAVQARPPYRHFHSRPDLKPAPVSILTRTGRASPGYIFIAPKRDVAQTGPLILDNQGQVVWFLPLDTKGVTDFRVQRYRGRPVLTWWRGRTKVGAHAIPYAIYDASYRPIAHVQPGNDLGGDIHPVAARRQEERLRARSRRPFRLNCSFQAGPGFAHNLIRGTTRFLSTRSGCPDRQQRSDGLCRGRARKTAPAVPFDRPFSQSALPLAPGRCCHLRASLPVQQRVVRALRVRFVGLALATAKRGNVVRPAGQRDPAQPLRRKT